MKYNNVDIKPIIPFILFILGMLAVCFVGITNVKADTTFEGIGYVTDKTNFIISNGKGTDLNLTLKQTYNIPFEPRNIVISVNNNFEANFNYRLEIHTPNAYFTGIDKVQILSNNITCNFVQLLDESTAFPKIEFNCPSNVDYIVIGLENSSGYSILTNSIFSWNYAYLFKSSELTGGSNEILQNQNQQMIDQNNQIIQGQEDIKEEIKDGLNNCRPSKNLLDLSSWTIENGILNDNDTITSNINNGYYVGLTSTSLNDVLLQNKGKKYTFSFVPTIAGKNVSIVIEGENNGAYKIQEESALSVNYLTLTISNEFTKINSISLRLNRSSTPFTDTSTIFSQLMFIEGTSVKYEAYGKEICQSKIDETNDILNETNNQLSDLNSALTDSSPTDMSGLGDSAGWLPPGPVDSILTLPLTMLTNLVTNLSNGCQSLSIELPFVNKNITLPCIKSLYDKMGVTGTLFTTAGLIASAFILFNYLLALYKWVDDTLTMRENTMPGYFDDNWGGGA